MTHLAVALCFLPLLAAPLAAEAQPAEKVARLGVLSQGSGPPPEQLGRGPVNDALKALGWIEGRNLVVERRFAGSRLDQLPAMAAELVRLKVDVIVAIAPPAAAAAREATRAIPIVMWGVPDPVALGYAASLARPGGNMTGVAFAASPEAGAKLMELLKETVPSTMRAAGIYNTANTGGVEIGPAMDAAAPRLGLQYQRFGIRRPEDVEEALKRAEAWRPDAVAMIGDPLSWSVRKPILDFIARHRLPSAFGDRDWVPAGGLMAYGLDVPDSFRRTAAYVDRIFRGANPADLPIEQPTKFELVINLKTAKALGLTIPPAVLARADELIQ